MEYCFGWSEQFATLIIIIIIIIFFFDLRGCPGQLAHTTTNPMAHWTPCKPSGHVRHRGGDRRAHEDSNPGAAGEDKPLLPPGQDPQCIIIIIINPYLKYLILIMELQVK